MTFSRVLPSMRIYFFFFFNDTATTEIYTLSLHDALPISSWGTMLNAAQQFLETAPWLAWWPRLEKLLRSEEHTSELQSQSNLVCRLLLEKKKKHVLSLAAARTENIRARHPAARA